MDETTEQRIAALEQEVKALRAACEAAGRLKVDDPSAGFSGRAVTLRLTGTDAIRSALENGSPG